MKNATRAGLASRRNYICLVSCLVVSSLLFTGCLGKEQAGMPSSTGIVEADEIKVTVEVSGILEEMMAQEGQTVEAGQELARLDARSYSIRVEEAAAGVQATDALLDEAKAGARGQEIDAARREAEHMAEQATALEIELAHTFKSLEKYRQLYQQGAVSEQEFLDRENQHSVLQHRMASAKAAVEAAMAKVNLLEAGSREQKLDYLAAGQKGALSGLDTAKLYLEKTIILAPRQGTVLSLNYNSGEFVRPGSEVITIQDNSKLWINTYLPQKMLEQVKQGDRVEVKPDHSPEEVYIGTISYLSPRAEFTPRNVHTSEERANLVFRVKVELEEGNGKLKPGMSVEIFFVTVRGE